MGTPAHKCLRVLFADDEASLQEFMRTELPRLGHDVTVCPDGKSAVKALKKSRFDVAILDLRMPGLDGIQVLEQLKQISPDTEAVMMTGHGSMETAVEALRLGALQLSSQALQARRDRGRAHRSRRETCAQAQEPRPANARPVGRRPNDPGRQIARDARRSSPHQPPSPRPIRRS